MKSWLWLSISFFVVGCSSGKEEIKGRPPGVVTSEQDDALKAQKEADLERLGKKKKAKIDEDALAKTSDGEEEDLDVWSEDEDIDLWEKESEEDEEGEEKMSYSPVFEIDGWPYQESASSFRLLWGAPKGDAKVYDKPDLRRDPIGEVEFAKDEEIRWDSTMVAVVSPSTYTAKEEVLVEGFKVTSGFLTGDEGFSATLPKGGTLQLLVYAGDGLCYMVVQGQVVQADCPTKKTFSGRFSGIDAREQMQPLARVWWIHFGGSEGAWIPLDNRFIVEIY